MNKAYKIQLEMDKIKSNLNPDSVIINKGDLFKNADCTFNDSPALDCTWKYYWQVFATKDFPATCPFCGKPFSGNDVDGCHIKIRSQNSPSTQDTLYKEKEYIIPGHHKCNMQLGGEFKAAISIVAIEAIKNSKKQL